MPTNTVALYDPAAMLDMDTGMAQGFAILLTGASTHIVGPVKGGTGAAKAKKSPNKQVILLGFASLTDGNVLEACFGVKSSSSTAAGPGQQMVREAKQALRLAQDRNATTAKVAVSAYAAAFQAVLKFRSEASKLNFLTRCFKYGALQAACKEALTEVFAPLEDVIKESL